MRTSITSRYTAGLGYFAPNGAFQVFPDAFAFRPERFIDDEGKLKKVNEFIPFSIGKRQCPGEGLARTELFLFLANILNAFKLTAGNRPPSMKRTYGIFASCGPFTCRVGKR
ncbi:CYP-33A1 protein [Aphelenchoides avenae]|nr:CYP-33A1 protein [Aphelenchus avenae]